MNCKQSEIEVVFGLLLKMYDWSELSTEKRDQVKEKLATFFAIPKEFVYLDSISNHDLNAMHLMSIYKGSKNIKDVNYPKQSLGRASFVIGCGANLFNMGKFIAKDISHQIKDGTINALTEENFGKWMIFNRHKELTIRSERVRRQSQNEGSGADNDEDYDYGDEDVSDLNTEVPVVSTTHAHRHHHAVSALIWENVSAPGFLPTVAESTRLVTSIASTPLEASIVTNVEEEIKESVSKLESVISKTIENTKNIKELALITMDVAVDNGEQFELQRLGAIRGESSTHKQNDVEITLTTTDVPLLSIGSPITLKNPFSIYNNPKEFDTESVTNTSMRTQGSTAVIVQVQEKPTLEFFSPRHANFSSNKSTLEFTTTPQYSSSSVMSFYPSSFSASTNIEIENITSTSSPKFLTSTIQYPSTETTMSTLTESTILATPQSNLSKVVNPTIEANAISNADFITLIGNELGSSIDIPSSTFAPVEIPATLDDLESAMENSPPIIKTRLQKLAVTSGKAFKFIVPEQTFADAEDYNNLRLELTDMDGNELKGSSWVQFNSDKRELYGLPLDDTVSRWQYCLTATDSSNASTSEVVEISVQQHRAVRTINHEISIGVEIVDNNDRSIDWQLKLIHALVQTLHDLNSAAVVVREIRQQPQNLHNATFVYFNETLPSIECPEEALNDILSSLDVNRLNELVQPMLSIKSIAGNLIGSCQKVELNQIKPTITMTKNLPPMPRNQVDRVNASVGQLLVYKVPGDTFYDPNDNELTLTLKSKDHKELSARQWLQFDSKNQEFFGIPKSGDIGSEEYLLVAEDSGGLSATDALVVVVAHAHKKEFSTLFKAYLAIRHENFNADLQRKFVERIAKIHNDANTNKIQIRSITTHHDSDGTIVNFYNTSLFKVQNRCPDKELAATRNVYLDNDQMLREGVKRWMGPDLNLTNFSVVPIGSCHITDYNAINPHEFIPKRPEEPRLKSTFSEHNIATFILPAIIIVVMILLASIIACCLHRRRNKSGKMELGDDEERKSFRNKGIPVIFQDEFEEKPEMGNKSPVILKDEKPPLLPPSYNTSNMNGDNDVDEYVPPPAVVVGGREARGKSPATPSYRKPPPYVSP
ncbi:uncharacterized protein Dg isoform X2 [Drosophila tropicalis]